MNVILVGYGLSGQVFHAPLLKAAGFNIAAIVVNDPERCALAVAQNPKVLICASLTEVLQKSDAPLVVIASPTEFHAPLSIEALNAGRHVVVDKPVALSAIEFAEMMRVAKTHNKHIIPFQNRRWDADFLTLKNLIAHNKLGDIVRYEARFDRFNPIVKDRWREHDVQGAGMLYDLAPHLIDQAVHVLGAPDWVFCTLLTQRVGAQINDGFELIMGKDSGDYPYVSLGASQFSAAADQPHGAPRFKIQGRKATWLKSGFDPQEASLRTGVQPNNIAWIAEDVSARGRLIDGETGLDSLTDAGIGEWPWFYHAVKNTIEFGSEPPVSSNDALVTCAIIDAALLSQAIKSRVLINQNA